MLDEQLASHEFSAVIDATRGKIASRLGSIAHLDAMTSLSLSCIRRVDDGSLSTTGRLFSLSVDEVAEQTKDLDLAHTLILDDTSFSGTTNVRIEEQLRNAHRDCPIETTHGSLIINEGELGNTPGARTRLKRALAGRAMHTPEDDGWHIFDILPSDNLEEHLAKVQRTIHADEKEWKAILERGVLFPGNLDDDTLRRLAAQGEFIPQRDIVGSSHMKNPQLLMTMIRDGHIDPPHKWHMPEDDVFQLLLEIGDKLHGER